MLVDTHCHLDAASCPEGADAVLGRARSAGVRAFVAVGVGGGVATEQVVALAARRADVVATVGVHPHDAATCNDDLTALVEALAGEPRVVAVGEIGLDHHYDHSPREVQARLFRHFIAVARRARKPVVVHTREAADDTLAILRDEDARDVGGVIHCFSEDRRFAREALDLGFDLSFSGIVTFKNARAVQDVAAWAPLERILVETDSPYLAPVPVRGKRNEPAFVVHTARRIAELRGLPVDEIARRTTQNAVSRFGAPLAAALESVAAGG